MLFQEKFINQKLVKICAINTSLYFLLLGPWCEQKSVAVFTPHRLPSPLCPFLSVSQKKHPFYGVGGLRKDQIEEKEDNEKAEKTNSAENCLLLVRE